MMERCAALATRLYEGRAVFAGTVAERAGTRDFDIPATLVRALLSALATAIEQADPAPVTEWAARARGTCSVALIHLLVETATQLAAEAGEVLHIDFSALLVFLEIVKAAVSDAYPTAVSGSAADRTGENSIIDGVLAMLNARDTVTCAHSQATGSWCRRLAGAMALSPAITEVIVKAGVLHDIGKIATPDEILFKPTALDRDEWLIMERHAVFGAQILSELPALAPYAPIVRAHHERWDGTGYPHGLAGDQIPFEARVVAVADAFHAMISERPYRAAIPQREAMAILREGRGTQWDATVVDAMLRMLDAPRTKAVVAKRAAHG